MSYSLGMLVRKWIGASVDALVECHSVHNSERILRYFPRLQYVPSLLIFRAMRLRKNEVTATTGFSITVKGAIQIIAAFIHAGNPMYVSQAVSEERA